MAAEVWTDPRLSKQQQQTLRLARRAPWQAALGFVLASLGGLYGYWGAQHLDLKRPLDTETAFDRPVARLAILQDSKQKWLDGLKPTTDLEHQLIDQLKLETELIVRLILVLIRILLATMVILSGLLFFQAGLLQIEYWRIIQKLGK